MIAAIIAILGFCFVIVIHELGHFVFAKWAGVKVLTFSVGFGPAVWSKQIGETKYQIALLWLGGYVQMLGEGENDAGREDPRSFAAAKPKWRALILIGGVLFNLVSSWLILVALASYGMPLRRPVVGGFDTIMPDPEHPGEVLPSPAARLGLKVGDEIRVVNGVRTRSADELMIQVAQNGGVPLRLEVRRDGHDLTLTGDGAVTALRSAQRGAPMLGIEIATSRTIGFVIDAVGERLDVVPRRTWELLEIDGVDVTKERGQAVLRMLDAKLGEEVTLAFLQPDGMRHQTTLRWGGLSPDELALGLPVRVRDEPDAGTPAATAGIHAGDLLTACDGQPIRGTTSLSAAVQRAADNGRPLTLELWRGRERSELTMSPVPGPDGKARIGVPIEPLLCGWLPVVAPVWQGGGLAAGGALAGDALLSLDLAHLDRTARRLPARVLRGGEPRQLVVHLPRETRSALAPLAGRRIVTRSADGIHHAGADGVEAVLSTTALTADVLAALADLTPGDWVLRVGPLAGREIGLETLRGGTVQDIGIPLGDAGLGFAFETDQRPYVLEYPGEQVALANQAACDMVTGTLKMIPKFFRPKAADGIDATKSLSGPIGIFSMLKDSFTRFGFAGWLHVVALIGLNLFLVNLLPIPIVDGGQLVQLGIEVLIRRPLPVWLKTGFAYLGLALVLSLMLFVLSLDVLRQFGIL
jgi:membrane-associated protease RseP (regulator of RpoE activity)